MHVGIWHINDMEEINQLPCGSHIPVRFIIIIIKPCFIRAKLDASPLPQLLLTKHKWRHCYADRCLEESCFWSSTRWLVKDAGRHQCIIREPRESPYSDLFRGRLGGEVGCWCKTVITFCEYNKACWHSPCRGDKLGTTCWWWVPLTAPDAYGCGGCMALDQENELSQMMRRFVVKVDRGRRGEELWS